jgi:hypothetical protein
MYNAAYIGPKYSNWRVLGGMHKNGATDTRMLFAGPDPADPSRILIKKLVLVSNNLVCLEETRITPFNESNNEGNADKKGVYSAHSQIYRLAKTNI